MKKSGPRFSLAAVLAALLCFAPGAFAQGAAQAKLVGGNVILSQMSASFFAPAPSHHQNGNNGCGCGNQSWGWDQGGNGNCSQVPEGGTTAAYLALAGLFCVGAAIFRLRRQAGLRPTN